MNTTPKPTWKPRSALPGDVPARTPAVPPAERPDGTPAEPPPDAQDTPVDDDRNAQPAEIAEPTRPATGRPGSARAPAAPPAAPAAPVAPAGPSGDDAERLARVALTRLVEPGDEDAGRWLRTHGAVALLRWITGDAPPPAPAAEPRLARYRRRLGGPDARQDLAAAEAAGARFVCPGDTEWPRQLDDLAAARPLGLWVRGRVDLRLCALRSVAVVGARACTEYGAHVAATLAAGLAHAGWAVVSGAAYGVDAAAHRGALAATGATVGVLACGVDRVYPPGHTELLGRVADQGLVVAELAPGDHPTRSRFLLRNRVMAALTRGTVVVEAERRSGSLVTARWAQRLGRPTMGIPGPVTSGLSAGVHELLRGGAELVTEAAEVAELVGNIGADLAPVRRGPVVPRDLLPAATARVLEAVPGRGTAPPEQIAHEAGTERDEALGRLHELQSLGFVARDGTGWRLARRPSEHPIR
ncbi:DNA-processing protein DprA [Streptomyces sp. MAR4 CNX-425]|uniref:DNA-processing protein DprA n=1 Tax=Streptomyces sp. MAR4 CNX-425 TaxID=3406343 RepID=UPI003B5024D1